MMNRKSKSNVKSFQEENNSLKYEIESIVHIDLSYLQAEDVSMYVYVQMKSVILQLFSTIFRPDTLAFIRVNGLKTRYTPL